jgi:alpha-tubulin suppressor-like RCC1 family protein
MPTVFGTASETSTVTLYYDSGCATPKSAATANTAFASPGITVNSNVNANNSTIIYGKAIDTAGNASGCTSLVTYVNDSTAPTVSLVTSSTANNSYKAGQAISIQVTFTESVTVTGFPQLTLATGGAGTAVNYSSGSGTTSLTFTYTVGAGENSADLDYVSTSSLALNGGTIKDSTGNNATLTLPGVGGAFSIAGTKAIVIDTITPTVTYSSISPISPNVSTTPTITATLSETVSNFTLYSNSGCSTAISGTTGASAGSATKTTNALTANSTNTIFAQVTDAAGNISACTSMTTYVNDSVIPTVSSVTSTAADGAYKATQLVPITVTFTEAVVVTGTPQITLGTGGGGNNAVVNYSSGSGTTVLTFNYTVVNGQNAADLDYIATTSLGLNSGTIKDASNNNATLTLPAPGGASSIGGQKNIVIDTTAPTISTITGVNGTYAAGTVVDIDVNFSESVTQVGTNSTLTLSNGYLAVYQSKPDGDTIRYRYTVMSGHSAADLNVTAFNVGTDSIKDQATTDATLTLPVSNNLADLHNVIIDTSSPTVALTSSTSSHTSGAISMTATFSESVTGFVVGDVTVVNGTAGSFSGSASSYSFTVTPTSAGTVSISISASVATDTAGNYNTASATMNFTYSVNAASYYHAWGQNSSNQHGDGLPNAMSMVVTQVGVDNDWQAISAGGSFSHAIRSGRLYAWGLGTSNQLGDGTSVTKTLPVQIGTATDWTAVSNGQFHGLGLRSGTLWAWGFGGNGRIGDGTALNRSSPVQIGVDSDWTMVAAGGSHSLGIKGGKLYAWGLNTNGQVGDGTTTQRLSPVQIGTDTDWTWISAAQMGSFSMGIRAGRLYAWGLNTNGQLGLGDQTQRTSPVQVGAFTDWTMVSAGSVHTVALRAGGQIYAWGLNSSGQLGDGTTTQRTSPVQIGSDTTWTAVNAGHAHSVAMKSGEIWSFGNNQFGQHADGTTVDRSSPVRIGSDSNWSAIEIGFHHNLMLSAGKLYVIGNNSSGQLGITTSTSQRLAPTQIGTDSNWSKLSAGGSHTLGIRDGVLYAWGTNSNNQLGDGTNVTRTTPVKIGAFTDWTHVAAGLNASLAIRAGRLYGWGYNLYGTIGDGTQTQRSAPVQIGVDTNWTDVALSYNGYHALGIKGGQLYAWGYNNVSQLGDGTTTNRLSPVLIDANTTWTSIGVGTQHSLGIRGGMLFGWGVNSNGQVGDGTGVNKTTPVQIGALTTWTKVVGGSYHSFALRAGTLWGWGVNSSYQLGDGSVTQRTAPVQIGAFTNWTDISAGGSHGLGVRGGMLYAWGSGANGRLGDGTTTTRTTPVQIGAYTNWTAVSAGTSHSVGLTGSSSGEIIVTSQPISQTASGGQATFSVAAFSPQNLGITYQWQRSTDSGVTWAAVDGGTDSTLYLIDLTSANNNQLYRCVLNTNGMTVTTSSALLTSP